MTDGTQKCKPEHDASLIVLAGPTASGKTALAIALAQRLNGVIINGDSIQLYADLPTLTARPTLQECAAAPHTLYGIMGPEEETSAMGWCEKARREIEAAHAQGRIPIICGGTGLYLTALIDGLSPVPDVPEETRQKWRTWVADVGAEAAHTVLSEDDPVMAERLRPSDTQRITRALEVLDATGQSLAHWQSLPPLEAGLRPRAAICALEPPRDWLTQRCDARFDLMLDDGAADEVAALLSRDIALNAPVFRALGAREIAEALRGIRPWENAINDAKTATRRYAKRQANWNRTQLNPDLQIFAQDMETRLDNIRNFIVNFGLTLP